MSDERVKLTIDGREVEVPKGTLLVDAAKAAGIHTPVFCHHPKLEPVGVCRMCLVAVEGMRKLTTACTTPASDGMVVHTDTEPVVEGRKGTLEFLLANHPLDCPVCDKGGECDLQDQSFAYGAGTSRLGDFKLRKNKAVDLGPFIVLDEERCVLCRRCTRFDEEITFENNLIVGERGHEAVITTAEGEPYNSYFSGDTIELCPVGALTSREYRFKARPWDVVRVPSICTGCSVGCSVRYDFRRGELQRVVPHDNPEVDGGWLCDRGRFNYNYVHSPDLLTQPLLRRDGELVPVTWAEALREAARRLGAVVEAGDSERIGLIGGGRLTNEEAFLFQKLGRAILGTPHIDHRVSGQRFTSLPDFGGTERQLEEADAVLVVDALPAEQAPVLDLKIRRAVGKGGAKLSVLGTALPAYNLPHERLAVPAGASGAALRQVLAAVEAAGAGGPGAAGRSDGADAPGADAPAPAGGAGATDEAGPLSEARVATLREALTGEKRVALVWGGEDAGAGEALYRLARRLKAGGAQVNAYVLGAQANSRGAEAMGVHPELLPGSRPVADEAARRRIEKAWRSKLPAGEGLSAGRIVDEAAAGEFEALYLVSANPVGTHPNGRQAQAALERTPFVVVQDLFLTETAQLADLVLPAAPFTGRAGHYTTLEGRVQAISEPLLPTAGESRPDGVIFRGLAESIAGKGKLAASDQELVWEMQHVAGTEAVREGAFLPECPAELLAGEAARGGREQESAAVRDGQSAAPDSLLLVPVDRLHAGGGTARFDRPFQTSLGRGALVNAAVFHPEDARRLALRDGDEVELATAHGSARYRVRVAPAAAPMGLPGFVFAPKGLPGAPVNRLTRARPEAVEVRRASNGEAPGDGSDRPGERIAAAPDEAGSASEVS